MLLGMLDTAALNIINVNIDSLEAANMQKVNCNTNISDAKKPNTKQETRGVKESCTNTEEDLKDTNNIDRSNINTNPNTLINYFLLSPNIEIEQKEKH